MPNQDRLKIDDVPLGQTQLSAEVATDSMLTKGTIVQSVVIYLMKSTGVSSEFFS